MSDSNGKPNDWAARHAAVDAAAKAIIDQEISERDAKTASLRALREAAALSAVPEIPVARPVRAKKKTLRAKSQRLS